MAESFMHVQPKIAHFLSGNTAVTWVKVQLLQENLLSNFYVYFVFQ